MGDSQTPVTIEDQDRGREVGKQGSSKEGKEGLKV